jgi:hypothetical protein
MGVGTAVLFFVAYIVWRSFGFKGLFKTIAAVIIIYLVLEAGLIYGAVHFFYKGQEEQRHIATLSKPEQKPGIPFFENIDFRIENQSGEWFAVDATSQPDHSFYYRRGNSVAPGTSTGIGFDTTRQQGPTCYYNIDLRFLKSGNVTLNSVDLCHVKTIIVTGFAGGIVQYKMVK